MSTFEDESFDGVLNLGAYYHLKDKKERDQAVQECLRVLKKGGIFCVAYLNKFANYAKFSDQMKDDFEIFEVYMEKGYSKNHDIFCATTPEDVEEHMERFKLTQLHNIGTDGALFTMVQTVNQMNKEVFERWLKIHFQNCEKRSILGYSEHGLYIGEK